MVLGPEPGATSFMNSVDGRRRRRWRNESAVCRQVPSPPEQPLCTAIPKSLAAGAAFQGFLQGFHCGWSQGLARISHRVAGCMMKNILFSASCRPSRESLPAQTVLGTPSLVFFPPAHTCSLKRSPRYAFGRRHSLKTKLPARSLHSPRSLHSSHVCRPPGRSAG